MNSRPLSRPALTRRFACCSRGTPIDVDDGSPALIRIVDLETTGNGFTDGGVVEIGWQDIERRGDAAWRLATRAPSARLVRPSRPISAVTSAIHHIVDEDVVGAPAWPEVGARVFAPESGRRPIAFAAHRAAFEQRWCGKLAVGTRWICTWKCALRVWPDAPTHSNQGLRYWRRPDGLDRATALPAHRAGPDAYVTAHHLRDLLALASLDTLIAWSEQPGLLPRVPFGPHRGKSWVDLDDDALARIAAGEGGGREDVRFTAREEMTRRRVAGGGSDPGSAATVGGQPCLPLGP